MPARPAGQPPAAGARDYPGRSRQRGQALVNDREPGVNVGRVDDERWREAERAAPASEEQEPLAERALHERVHEISRGLPGLLVLHELDADHQAESANIADGAMPAGELP